MNLLEVLGIVFLSSSVLNFIVGFFAVKTPISMDKSDDIEKIEEENFSEMYS